MIHIRFPLSGLHSQSGMQGIAAHQTHSLTQQVSYFAQCTVAIVDIWNFFRIWARVQPYLRVFKRHGGFRDMDLAVDVVLTSLTAAGGTDVASAVFRLAWAMTLRIRNYPMNRTIKVVGMATFRLEVAVKVHIVMLTRDIR
jgi:hypothetical protein